MFFMCVKTDWPSLGCRPSVESPEQRDMLRSTFSAEEKRERGRKEGTENIILDEPILMDVFRT